MNAFTPANFGLPIAGQAGLTATGSTQADAFVLNTQASVFSSVPAGTGAVLPSSYAPGATVTVCNRDSNNPLLLYPARGDRIESGSANIPVSVPVGGNFTLISFDPPLAAHPRTWWETGTYNQGGYLPLAGGTLTGTLGIAKNTTWAGGYPGTNVALFSEQSYAGTLSSLGYAGVEGSTAAYNLISVTDNLTYTPVGPGGKAALEVVMDTYGGQGAATGMLLTYQFLAPADYPNIQPIFSAGSIYGIYGGHITGATSGAGGIGDLYGLGIQIRQVGLDNTSTPTYMHALRGLEIDLETNGPAGSTCDYVIVLNLGSGGTMVQPPTTFGAYVSMYAGGTLGTPKGQLPYGLSFGNPESGIPPVLTTGTLIGAATASTAALGIDFYNYTFTTAFIRGPNSFAVLNQNWVVSDVIRGATSSTVYHQNQSGNPTFSTTGAGSTINYIQATGTTAGNPAILTSVGPSDANVPMFFRTGGTAGTTPKFNFQNLAGSQSILQIGAVLNPVSGFNLVPAASGNILMDVLGTATGITIGGSVATGVAIGNASANVQIGAGAAVATNATTGMILIPTCAGAPTGNVGALGKVALIWDSTDSKLYVGTAGTWKSVTLT